MDNKSRSGSQSDSQRDSQAALFGQATVEIGADEWLGRVIDDRYRILERLGEGGMGAVFIAEHTKLRKRVALKVIHAHFAGNHEIAARFAREAMTSAHIEHPNVASALDFGALPEGGAYLVMQLVLGPSLSEYLAQRGALPYPEACQIAMQIADAVAAAHASGIVHRDLKPDNVILMPNEGAPATVKVLDFGIAHVKAQNDAPDQVAKAITRMGVVIGTPGYMPPEQATGQPVDERVDLYALGVILWELLMGEAPFNGATFSDIVTRQLNAPAPELVLNTAHDVPEELRKLLRSLLERSPADRASSASAVRDALRTFAAESARGESMPTQAARQRHSYVSAARTLITWTSSMPPRRLRLGAIGVVVLVVALGWALHGDDANNSQVAPTSVVTSTPSVSAERAVDKPRPDVKKDDEPSASKTAAEPSPNETRVVQPVPGKRASKRAPAKKSETRTKSDQPRPVQRLKRALGDLLQ